MVIVILANFIYRSMDYRTVTVKLTDNPGEASQMRRALETLPQKSIVKTLIIHGNNSTQVLVDMNLYFRCLTTLSFVAHDRLNLDHVFFPCCETLTTIAIGYCTFMQSRNFAPFKRIKTLFYWHNVGMTQPLSDVFPSLRVFRGDFDYCVFRSVFPSLTTCICTYGIPADASGQMFVQAHPNLCRCVLGICVRGKDAVHGFDLTVLDICCVVCGHPSLEQVDLYDMTCGFAVDVVAERIPETNASRFYQEKMFDILLSNDTESLLAMSTGERTVTVVIPTAANDQVNPAPVSDDQDCYYFDEAEFAVIEASSRLQETFNLFDSDIPMDDEDMEEAKHHGNERSDILDDFRIAPNQPRCPDTPMQVEHSEEIPLQEQEEEEEEDEEDSEIEFEPISQTQNIEEEEEDEEDEDDIEFEPISQSAPNVCLQNTNAIMV